MLSSANGRDVIVEMRNAVMVVSVLAACGGGGDGEWVPPDVDKDETIDKLGAAGYAKLCSEFDSYVRDMYRSNKLIQAACTVHALETTTNATECGDALAACLDDLPPAVESSLMSILAQASCTNVGVMQSGCTSPVSALTTCLDDLGAQLDTLQLSATCAAFGSPVPPSWWRISPPASCSSLASGC